MRGSTTNLNFEGFWLELKSTFTQENACYADVHTEAEYANNIQTA